MKIEKKMVKSEGKMVNLDEKCKSEGRSVDEICVKVNEIGGKCEKMRKLELKAMEKYVKRSAGSRKVRFV